MSNLNDNPTIVFPFTPQLARFLLSLPHYEEVDRNVSDLFIRLLVELAASSI